MARSVMFCLQARHPFVPDENARQQIKALQEMALKDDSVKEVSSSWTNAEGVRVVMYSFVRRSEAVAFEAKIKALGILGMSTTIEKTARDW